MREFLFGRARRRPADLTFHGAYGKIYNRRWPAWVNRGNPDDSAPAVEHPKDFLVLAAWGAGTGNDQMPISNEGWRADRAG